MPTSPTLSGNQDNSWQALTNELEHWQLAGHTARLWLRDDDAMHATLALERLLGTCAKYHVRPLLCVIPQRAETSLAERLSDATIADIAMHGIWHRNFALPGEKSHELAAWRGKAELLAELGAARERLISMFGARAGTWYVPPWNRIAPEVAALLPQAGFSALSTFASNQHDGAGLIERNTHVDLIDWRNGRIGRNAAWIADALARELAMARTENFRPVGILTHHLDHDATAWAGLEQLLALTTAHSAVLWISADSLLTADGGRSALRSG